MKSNDFVEEVIKSVIDENLEVYRSLFEDTDRTRVSDNYWKTALKFYENLSEENREALFSIIKQIQIDTISNFLGIIDGTSYLSEEGEFDLKFDENKLNGELQDIFLSKFE